MYGARLMGERRYQQLIRAGLDSDEAFRLARQHASDAALSIRRRINKRVMATGVDASTTLIRKMGKPFFAALPFIGTGIIVCNADSVSHVGRDVLLDLSGFDLSIAGGEGLVAFAEYMEGERDALSERLGTTAKWGMPGTLNGIRNGLK